MRGLRDKLSLHQIAKHNGLSRNSIRKWLSALDSTQPAYQRSATFNKLSPFSSATVKLTNIYMQSATFAHREFKVTARVVADARFRRAMGATAL